MTVLNEKLLGVNEEGFEWYLNIGLTKHLHEDQLSVDGEIIGKKLMLVFQVVHKVVLMPQNYLI